MKKKIVLFIVAVAMLSVVGCSGTEEIPVDYILDQLK